MPSEKPKPPHVTRDDIEQYLAWDEERKSFNRQAEDVARKMESLKQKLTSFVELKGGDARSVERSGFVLAIKTAAGTPKWKSEFIQLAGDRADELVAQVIAAAPRREFLSVESKQ
jgi:hypothetical protein